MSGWRVRRGHLLLIAVLAALLLGAMMAEHVWPQAGAIGAQRLLAYARSLGVAGSVVLAGAQVLVALSGILPAAVLGIAAGSLYGLTRGFLLAAASTLFGAWVAFALSRSVCRPAIVRLLDRRVHLRDLDARVAREGWRLVTLMRVSPVMPFSMTSYALGLSAVRSRDYMLGTLASLPALFGYVMMGAVAGFGIDAPARGATWLHVFLLAVGAVASVILAVRVGRLVAAVAATPPARADAEASHHDCQAGIYRPGAGYGMTWCARNPEPPSSTDR